MRAYDAFTAAGHKPHVVNYGCYSSDRLFAARRRIKRLTGDYKVPTLVLEDERIVDDSEHIVAWASANPA